MDLQYLPPDKQREPDADIRKMLIEAIMLVSRASAAKVSPPNRDTAHTGTWLTSVLSQLTATAPGRQQVRDQGAYLILRELHSWEPEPHVRVTCEKLIQVGAGAAQGGGGCPWCAGQLLTCLPCWQVLIGDEPEQGMENLLEVQVPEEVERQLQQLDHQEQEQCEQERLEQALAPGPQAEGAAPT